jgi:hypothetical protein
MKNLFKKLYEANIQEIKAIRNLAIEYDMLNEQETLDWLDEMNKLSIDPEQ